MPATNKKTKYGFGKIKDSTDLTLPSHEDPDDPKSPHNVCRVKRPGVQGLIAAGVLDSFDSLTALVQSEHIDRVNGVQEKRQAERALLMEDKESLVKALEMVDRVVTYVVVEPKLTMPPKNESERDPDVTYTDEVDLDDRMFILQFVLGGTRDLESFR